MFTATLGVDVTYGRRGTTVIQRCSHDIGAPLRVFRFARSLINAAAGRYPLVAQSLGNIAQFTAAHSGYSNAKFAARGISIGARHGPSHSAATADHCRRGTG
jgi:hypothetical protein